MIACLDVHYTGSLAHAAMVVFQRWDDEHPISRLGAVSTVEGEYVPGEFYKRELGPLLKVLSMNPQNIETLIIDGYCMLSEDGRPGLGAHLYSALDRRQRIIGVAKTHFKSAPAVKVLRGTSARPLYVTALGMPVQEAADAIVRMHGSFRLPTLLRAVDALARACPEGSPELL